jgi:hypothetical protein
MKKFAFTLALVLLVPSSAALAETNVTTAVNVSLHGDTRAGQNDDQKGVGLDVSSGTSLHQEDEQSTTGQVERSHEDEMHIMVEGNASSTERAHDTSFSGTYRSAVSLFVQALLHDADRDGGIGAEVRRVAQSQNTSASTTADAIAHVEARGKFWSLLFGTDWKNIGTLRSEIARTNADIARLNAALASTTDVSVKADLQTELTALTSEQAKVKTFVDAHANSFSLLGWFTKLFAGSSTAATTTVSS